MTGERMAQIDGLVATCRADIDAGRPLAAYFGIRSCLTADPTMAPALTPLYSEATWRALAAAVCDCDWTYHATLERDFRRIVEQQPHFWMVGETSLVLDTLDRRHLRAINERYCAATFPPSQQAFARRRPGARLRLGIIGCDFHAQATAYLFTGVAEAMDRDRVEVIAYDYGTPPDSPWRQRCLAAYDQVVSIAAMDDRHAAERIYADGVDVLIHMRDVPHGRLGICAWRPAPIQIQYLYFPGTSGAPFMDYLIADPVVVPPEMEDGFSERVLRLEGCYQPNDDKRERPAPMGRAAFGLSDDQVVLANFNQSYKITPRMFGLWCDLLKADPRRILWLLDGGERPTAHLRREAALNGVDPARLLIAPHAPSAVHLARCACADLIVDTYPYGGHTLTSDSLWAGTPVVTLMGQTFASRVAASLLSAVGLSSLVTTSERDYLMIADGVLRDPARRGAIRAELQSARRGALFDPADYARRFVAAIEGVVHRHLADGYYDEDAADAACDERLLAQS